MAKGPVLIDLETAEPAPSVADAPPVPDVTPLSVDGEAMRAAAQFAARKPSRLTRWFLVLVQRCLALLCLLPPGTL